MGIAGRYEYKNAAENADKYWELREHNGGFEVSYGRRGASPQTTAYDSTTAHKKASEKVSKGYVKVRSYENPEWSNSQVRMETEYKKEQEVGFFNEAKAAKLIDRGTKAMQTNDIMDKASIQGGFSRELMSGTFLKDYISDSPFFGYIGSHYRNEKRDLIMEKYLTSKGLGIEAIGFWLSSKDGRIFSDRVGVHDDLRTFLEKLKNHFSDKPFHCIWQMLVECDFPLTAWQEGLSEKNVKELDDAVKLMLRLAKRA